MSESQLPAELMNLINSLSRTAMYLGAFIGDEKYSHAHEKDFRKAKQDLIQGIISYRNQPAMSPKDPYFHCGESWS